MPVHKAHVCGSPLLAAVGLIRQGSAIMMFKHHPLCVYGSTLGKEKQGGGSTDCCPNLLQGLGYST